MLGVILTFEKHISGVRTVNISDVFYEPCHLQLLYFHDGIDKSHIINSEVSKVASACLFDTCAPLIYCPHSHL